MAIIVFNPAEFKQDFPQFAAISDSQLDFYFENASLYLENKTYSSVPDDKKKLILYLLTAHVAILLGALTASGAIPTSGRVSNAVQQDVQVETKYETTMARQWFIQTTYGAAAYQALLPYISVNYFPPLQRSFPNFFRGSSWRRR